MSWGTGREQRPLRSLLCPFLACICGMLLGACSGESVDCRVYDAQWVWNADALEFARGEPGYKDTPLTWSYNSGRDFVLEGRHTGLVTAESAIATSTYAIGTWTREYIYTYDGEGRLVETWSSHRFRGSDPPFEFIRTWNWGGHDDVGRPTTARAEFHNALEDAELDYTCADIAVDVAHDDVNATKTVVSTPGVISEGGHPMSYIFLEPPERSCFETVTEVTQYYLDNVPSDDEPVESEEYCVRSLE